MAARNAARNGVADRLTLRAADVLNFVPEYPRPAAILSNPPYIRTSELETLSPEVRSEPRMALDGGEDGLRFYRALLRIAREWLEPDGFCLFEIGYDQADDLRRMAAENGFTCSILRDYGGNDRVAELQRADRDPTA